MKRVFDFTVSLLLIIILSPLFLLISLYWPRGGLAIQLENEDHCYQYI